ncbi:MAG: tRNA (adenosine(37)-N6)-threonylcarbamoyltransferase complex dimerization subunit type 1 TsaB [Gammaproteobacteria bacterium]|nr:tRNA (adenosine(37)-N6)-threonylcarbamoyltransferase complex dimerization subunit type 1 TsaB [Gammaproteobacteria bacterium]
MKILAIDAATEACSAALQINDDVIARFEVAPQQHSQKLLPFVDELLAEAGMSLNQLDGIAYGQGPGSFTGVRIGVAITQGLAFGADLPTVGISSLATMAQQAINDLGAETVIAAIDARMSEVYLGRYQNSLGLALANVKETVIKPDSIEPLELEKSNTGPVIAVGTGWQTYEQELSQKFSAETSKILLPNAQFMLPLAVQQFAEGVGQQAELAQPNYVRDEVSWKKLPGR